jgi:hypothetical protein
MLAEVFTPFVALFQLTTTAFRGALDLIPLSPKHYFFLFPDKLSYNEIIQLWRAGIFPRLSGLAPAFTFAVLLSFVRYVLQNYFIKVRLLLAFFEEHKCLLFSEYGSASDENT